MNKRAIAILGAIFILIVATLSLLIYLRSRKSKTAEQTIPETQTEQTTTPEQTEQPTDTTTTTPVSGAVRLTDSTDQIVSPVLFFQGNGISYFNTSGHLFQTDLQVNNGTVLLSNKRELSLVSKSNLTKVIWPLNGNSFVAETGSSTKPVWSVYLSGQGEYRDLPSQVYSFDWMPSGDKIVFVWVDSSGKASLNIADPDTSNYQMLTDLYEPDNVIKVSPDGKNIAFYRTQSTDLAKNSINLVSIDGKNFSSVVKTGYNKGVLWSPDSQKLIFSKRDESSQKFGLWVANVATGEVKSLGVFADVDKALWTKNSQSVFVAVPNQSSASAQTLSQDTIYKIDISTGQSEQFQTNVAVDAQDLFLNLDETILFFKNAQDGALYYMPVGSLSTSTK